MDPLLHAMTLWSGGAASALVSATWQGLVLAACIMMVLRLLPGTNAASRSSLWMVSYLLVVLLHFSSALQWHGGHRSLAQGAAVRVSPSWGLAVAAVWGLLSIYRAVRLGASAWNLRGIARRATRTSCDAQSAALLTSGRRPVELCLSPDVDRPSVIGFRSPRILLPPALLAELSACELQQVILHEMEHLRRADDWTNLVQKVVLVLFPLNPVLLWIEHRLCSERELACDDGVLRQTRARKAYASCLTRLAEHSVLRQGASLALGAWERQSELSRRVYRILRQPETAFTSSRSRWVTVLLAFVVLSGAGELTRSPQLIRFDPQPGLASLAPASLPQAASPLSTGHLVLAKAVMPPASAPAGPAPAHQRARMVIGTPAVHRPLARPARSFGSCSASSRTVGGADELYAGLRQSPLCHTTRDYAAYAAVPVADGWLIIQL